MHWILLLRSEPRHELSKAISMQAPAVPRHNTQKVRAWNLGGRAVGSTLGIMTLTLVGCDAISHSSGELLSGHVRIHGAEGLL